MANPDAFGDDLYAALGPLTERDEALGYPLRSYCRALGQPFAQIEQYARDDGDRPGYALLLDLDIAPAEALPWLAQLYGVTLPRGTTEDEARQLIRTPPGMQRGTPAAMVKAAQRYLSGNKTVVIKERDGGAYKLTVYTYQQESPLTDWTTYTNYVTNPNFERDTTGWGTSGIGPFVGSGAAILRDTAVKYAGASALKVTTAGTNTGVAHSATKTITAGQTYTASFWMKGALGTERIQGLLGSSGTDFVQYAGGGGTIAVTSDWQQYTLTWTAAGSAASMQLSLRESASGGAPGTVWIDNVQITQASTVVPYIDGDGNGGNWTGTPGASTSTSISTTKVRDAIVEQKPAGITLAFSIIANSSYANVVATRATYSAVVAAYATYDVMRTTP